MRAPGTATVLLAGALTGGLLALSTAQIGAGVAAFVALAPLLLVIDRGAPPWAAVLGSWLGGVVFFAVALAWIPLAGFRGSVLGLLAVYVATLAISLASVGGCLAWIRGRSRCLFLTATPAVWITAEFLRSQGPLGYPWHHLGYALAAHPMLIQIASIGGLYALSLWIAGVNTWLVAMAGGPRRGMTPGAVLLSLPLLLGVRACTQTPESPKVRVAAVQPAIVEPAREVKAFQRNLGILFRLTEEASRSDPDLVVWPESAFERTLTAGTDAHRAPIDPLLGAVARSVERPLLTGAWRRTDEEALLYNSAVLVGRSGETVVIGDKVHPVPFYEARASNRFERAMARIGLWPGRFRRGERAGTARVRLEAGPDLLLGVLICLDSSYASLARDLRGRGADLLVEISNEAQTGPWSAVQHAHVSRIRAVETGAPLVRTANQGPTEWIDDRGRVVARLGVDERGTATAAVAVGGSPSIYVLLGDAPAFVAGLLIVFAGWGAHRRRRTGLHRPAERLRLSNTGRIPS